MGGDRLAVTLPGHFHGPVGGVHAEIVGELVGVHDWLSLEFDEFVPQLQAGLGNCGVEIDRVADDLSFAGAENSVERAVLSNLGGQQFRDEHPALIGGDGIAESDIDASPLFKTAATIDADDLASQTEQRTAGVARIDGTVHLDAVAIHQLVHARAFLEATHAADDAKCDRGALILRQDERISHGHGPIAHSHRLGIPERGIGKGVLPRKLNDGDVSTGIGANEFPAVEFAIGQTAPAFGPRAGDDMVVC